MNIYDISQKAGVSTATVSRVLNHSPRVSETTRARVLAVMEESGYVPNAFARSLGLNSMKTIGLLCPNAADPYLAHALSYLERELRRRQYSCLLSCCERDLSARKRGVELLAAQHVDGILLMGSTFVEEKPRDNEYIRKAARQMPVVILNAALKAPNVYSVLCDEKQATQEAARFLLESGRRRLLYLYHSQNHNGRNKLAGYRAAHEAFHVPVDETLLRFLPEDELSVPHVRDELLRLDKAGLRFDAVLASEDLLAVGALKYARAKGLTLPEDLSVIGYNNSGACLCCDPELTSVDNRLKAVCEHCVSVLLGVLEGQEVPQETVFTGELVFRQSTGFPSSTI